MEDKDHNKSFARLQLFDLDDLDDIVGRGARWFTDVKRQLKVEHDCEMTSDKFSVPSKAVLSRWLADGRDVMRRQCDMMENMKEMIELLKTEALADKEKVIRLQSELLERKEEQLKKLQSTVQTTVQDTVQLQMQSYSDALKTPTTPPEAVNPEIFRKVVKDVITNEDRSKNLMVFGLAEEDGEQLDEKISNVFLEIGEKPQLAAVRLRRRSEEKNGTLCRPVKVTLSSSTAVQQILSRARLLKQTEKLKMVYVSPDRTPEERSARRLLVEERKTKQREDTTRNFFIKGGKVCSESNT